MTNGQPGSKRNSGNPDDVTDDVTDDATDDATDDVADGAEPARSLEFDALESPLMAGSYRL